MSFANAAACGSQEFQNTSTTGPRATNSGSEKRAPVEVRRPSPGAVSARATSRGQTHSGTRSC